MFEFLQVNEECLNFGLRPLDEPRITPLQLIKVPGPTEQLLVDYDYIVPNAPNVLKVERRTNSSIANLTPIPAHIAIMK